jgi:hypothetical protein
VSLFISSLLYGFWKPYGNENWVRPVFNARFDEDVDSSVVVEEFEIEENYQQPKYILKPCLESHPKVTH